MASYPRRRFLKKSLVAAAGVAATPAIRVLAQDEKGSTSPNEKIAAAVIGVRGRGSGHVKEFLARDDVEIAYICDADEKVGQSKVEDIAKKQGRKPKFAKDMREMFDDASVDVVSTATPNHWHALTAIWAMQAGKDVYVEKPACQTISEGRRMIETARHHEKICQVGTQCRSSEAVRAAVEFIADGGIGEVNFARGLCYKRRKSIGAKGDYPIPEEVDFNLWSGPATYTDPQLTRERFHYDWHWQRHYGNGDLGNQGPHQTDIARWGLGLMTHPKSIISYGGRLGYQAERKDEAYVDAGDTANTEVSIYDYGTKCIVFETRGLSCDDSADEELNKLFQSTEGNKVGVVFYGSNGYVVQKSYGHCIAYDKDFNLVKEFTGEGDHFGNFIDVCRSRKLKQLHADVLEGHLSAGVSHLGNISYYLGEDNKVSVDEAASVLEGIKSLDDNLATLQRTVKHLVQNGVDLDKYPIAMGPLLKFNPKKEVFTNNDAACEMLTREYRKPFVVPSAGQV